MLGQPASVYLKLAVNLRRQSKTRASKVIVRVRKYSTEETSDTLDNCV